jgi:hypothetical protein
MAYCDYELLKRKVAAARQVSEAARQRLREHIQNHYC